MKICLVAATALEAQLLLAQQAQLGGHQLQVLLTGVGMVNTAWALGQHLALHSYDLLINVGVCGSFTDALALGQVVELVADAYPELGAESPEGWLDMKQLGLPLGLVGGMPIYNQLSNPTPSNALVPKVRGITVNTVHGTATSIAAVQAAWPVEVETMEGAAFLQAALQTGTPCYAFRGVSNWVQPRNRSAWQLQAAAQQVQQFVLDFLPTLPS